MSETVATALVTGATSGIGRAIVLALRAKNIQVHALGRNASALAELQSACGAIPLCADIRDISAIQAALAQVPVDILINNAGILSTRAAFQDIDPAQIDAMIDINLKAPMHLTRALLPGMLARKRGHLIFVGSIAGQSAYGNMGAYGPSKAGLSLFCDNLRCDLLGTGLRVSEIAPGRVQTDLYRNAIPDGQAKSVLYDGYRPLQPDDIARATLDLISMPAHVNVSRVEIYPTDQISGGGTMVKFNA